MGQLYLLMSWLLNSMEPSVSVNFTFFDRANEINDAVCDTYSMKKNASRYMRICSISGRETRTSGEYYMHFKSMIDELNQYHLFTDDVKTHKTNHKELYTCMSISSYLG